MLHRVAPVDEAHDVRFRLHNLVISRRFFALAHVAVPVRRATQDTDLPLSRSVTLATARALEDLRPLAGPEQVLAYLSRYTHRVAISNSRLISADAGGVTFKYKDYRLEGPDR